MGYINNNHPDFIDTLTSVQSAEKGDKAELQEQFKFKQVHNGLPSQKKHHLEMVRNEVELYDSKILEPRQKKNLKEIGKQEEEETVQKQSPRSSFISTPTSQIADLYNINKVISNFPREMLPQVPQTIRVINPPKKR